MHGCHHLQTKKWPRCDSITFLLHLFAVDEKENPSDPHLRTGLNKRTSIAPYTIALAPIPSPLATPRDPTWPGFSLKKPALCGRRLRYQRHVTTPPQCVADQLRSQAQWRGTRGMCLLQIDGREREATADVCLVIRIHRNGGQECWEITERKQRSADDHFYYMLVWGGRAFFPWSWWGEWVDGMGEGHSRTRCREKWW